MLSLKEKLLKIFEKTGSITIKTRGEICIIENKRKSRFIMADARKLTSKLESEGIKIDQHLEFHSLSPVCSKSQRYLKEKGLAVNVSLNI